MRIPPASPHRCNLASVAVLPLTCRSFRGDAANFGSKHPCWQQHSPAASPTVAGSAVPGTAAAELAAVRAKIEELELSLALGEVEVATLEAAAANVNAGSPSNSPTRPTAAAAGPVSPPHQNTSYDSVNDLTFGNHTANHEARDDAVNDLTFGEEVWPPPHPPPCESPRGDSQCTHEGWLDTRPRRRQRKTRSMTSPSEPRSEPLHSPFFILYSSFTSTAATLPCGWNML